MSNEINRRDFIKQAALTAAGVALTPFSIAKGAGKGGGKVRLGIIGLGHRGVNFVKGFASRSDVEIPAVCDIRKARAERAKKIIMDAGMSAPEMYTRGEMDYQRMVKRSDLDAIVIVTPWRWHVPMAVDSMKNGKYVGSEVPAATTVDGCWELVNTAESTGMHYMLLENECYGRDVLAVLKMVRKGLFGEMVHARCGYMHQIPRLFDKKGNFGPGSDDSNGTKSVWRTPHFVHQNGILYPTHAIGPVAHWLDINRGNRFLTMTAHATKARGLHNEVVKLAGKDSPNADVVFQQGDVVTATLTTANDETVSMTYNITLPRPASNGFLCQGTNGLWNIENNSIYLDGISPKKDEWESFDGYRKKYDSILWKKYPNKTKKRFGAISFLVRNAFVEFVKRKASPPIDVYDAVAWSVISPLSCESVAQGGAPVDFPDFTNGQWIFNKRIFKPEESGY